MTKPLCSLADASTAPRVSAVAIVLSLVAAVSCSVRDDSPSVRASASKPASAPRANIQAAPRPSLGVAAQLRTSFQYAPTKAPFRGRRAPAHSSTVIGRSDAWLDMGERILPSFARDARGTTKRPAVVSYPSRADGAFHVQDQQTGMTLKATLKGAAATTAQSDDGYVVYRNGFGGGDIIHRPTPMGTEDFVTLTAGSDTGKLRYSLALDTHVAGLRLVANTLELIDDKGAPRLRVAPPYVVDAKGARHAAHLAVSGCAYDKNPSPPWKHPRVAPGSASCEISVSWPRKGLAYPAIVDPSWSTTGDMATARSAHVAITYTDGTVVATSGFDSNNAPIAATEVYDPVQETWAATADLLEPLAGATGHLVNNGAIDQVLVIGGFNGTDVTPKTEVWDSGSGTWSYTNSDLTDARGLHASALLQDGKVLAVAGFGTGFVTIGSAELFDPAVGTWSQVGSVGTSRFNLTATRLSTGEVVAVGGEDDTVTPLNVVDVYDPVGQSWSAGAPALATHSSHVAAPLPGGRLLIAGGSVVATADYGVSEIYNHGSDSWAKTPPMLTPRDSAAGIFVPSGRLLVAGGFDAATNGAPATTAELFDIPQSKWVLGATMAGNERGNPTLNAVANKKTLFAGGFDDTNGTALTSSFLYDFGTLGDQCSASTDCTSGNCVDGVCCDSACGGGNNGDCLACSVAAGAAADGTCGFAAPAVVCAGATTACETAGKCSGASAVCPGVGLKSQGTVCDAAAGTCEASAVCDGSTNVCPAKVKSANGTVCSSASGPCENDATCDGVAAACPANSKKASGTVCAASSGACEADAKCDGATVGCPAKQPIPQGTVCAASSGPCETGASCDGQNITCPSKSFVPAGTVCAAAPDECKTAATCTGAAAACPATGTQPDGTSCNSGADICVGGNCTTPPPPPPPDAGTDSGSPTDDAGSDAGTPPVDDAGSDAGTPPADDAGSDSGSQDDAGMDAGFDVDGMAPNDAGSDGGVAQNDAGVPSDDGGNPADDATVPPDPGGGSSSSSSSGGSSPPGPSGNDASVDTINPETSGGCSTSGRGGSSGSPLLVGIALMAVNRRRKRAA